ncbi:MAG: tyrosine-protein phosphatase [Chloroflexota bacterium]
MTMSWTGRAGGRRTGAALRGMMFGAALLAATAPLATPAWASGGTDHALAPLVQDKKDKGGEKSGGKGLEILEKLTSEVGGGLSDALNGGAGSGLIDELKDKLGEKLGDGALGDKLGGLPGLSGGNGLPIPVPGGLNGIPVVGGLVGKPNQGGPVPLYAPVIPGVLYRSAQPSVASYPWLRDQGIKSVVNLRLEHDDDAGQLAASGIDRYLRIPIRDFSPPTDAQADQFLAFVNDQQNWPILVHCNLGVGRAGTMSVLARYALQGVPIKDAYMESLIFGGGPWAQLSWLERWAKGHAPGSYNTPILPVPTR